MSGLLALLDYSSQSSDSDEYIENDNVEDIAR